MGMIWITGGKHSFHLGGSTYFLSKWFYCLITWFSGTHELVCVIITGYNLEVLFLLLPCLNP